MSAPDDRHRSQPPSVREIADLVARLRNLTGPDTSRDPAERAAFLADRDALLARIPTYDSQYDDASQNGAGASTASSARPAASTATRHTAATTRRRTR